MRIRSIKPEFWRSKDISNLPPEDRLLFIGLWSYVDDNGVGRGELSDIVADLFADDMFKDPRETVARVSRGLARLSEGGLIHLYEVENRPYLSVCSWSRHQRIDKPAKARYPQYDADSRDCRETVARVSEIVAPGTGEQGNRGTGEQGNSQDATRPSSEVAVAPVRPDVERVLDYLDEALTANGSPKPSRTKKNHDAARLLIDKDHHTVEAIERAIDFATNDEFWRTNILSMSKLRDKYEQLRLAAQRTPRRPSSPDRQADVLRAELEWAAQADAQSEHLQLEGNYS